MTGRVKQAIIDKLLLFDAEQLVPRVAILDGGLFLAFVQQGDHMGRLTISRQAPARPTEAQLRMVLRQFRAAMYRFGIVDLDVTPLEGGKIVKVISKNGSGKEFHAAYYSMLWSDY